MYIYAVKLVLITIDVTRRYFSTIVDSQHKTWHVFFAVKLVLKTIDVTCHYFTTIVDSWHKPLTKLDMSILPLN